MAPHEQCIRIFQMTWQLYPDSDLFLTFTCNPKWTDILDALPPGQRSEYRPDIVACVFKRYLEELLNDIRKNHVLGVPVAYVYVIEFQKRGLPHCHLLIILSLMMKVSNENQLILTLSYVQKSQIQ